jgi:hypothetical protein
MLDRFHIFCFLALLSLVPVHAFAQQGIAMEPAPSTQPFSPTVSYQKIDGGYAIVVSTGTAADPDWAKVVQTLQVKYGDQARVITWKNSVDETQPGLAAMMPRYTCFVCTWKEANRAFVNQVHRLTRNLNDDPYPDTIWGILTGLDARDALRIASTSEPLVIHNVVSTTGVNNDYFDSIFSLSDAKPGAAFSKGEEAQAIHVPDGSDTDRSQTVATALETLKPDLFATSSHANERILEMPFSHGVFFAQNGDVVAAASHGVHGRLEIDHYGRQLLSPNPKVWVACGNCLTAHIVDRNSIALAMMHSAGVTQMVGYTVTTWYGAAGGTAAGCFQNQPGRFTLAESFFISDAVVTRRLVKEFPGRERFIVKDYPETDLGPVVRQLGEPFPETRAQQTALIGLTWDHDTLALYGDPAWNVRVAQHPSEFDQRLVQNKDGWELKVTARKDTSVRAFAFLPSAINSAHYQMTGDLKDSLLTNTYALADFGSIKAGDSKSAIIRVKT